ncbi:hypothetical protein EXIGLDRAFT_768777 [Exidia glandulosa HHB12029]|uniref:Protein kinase domain-containing protein n=1 Tax=Exidia glandulosa HHB12029 TaxID=1314781 RepID=A0A165HZ59_EXIGL|nr:hypothetical protein EXIGLDRAFT_768777 [Exidia glandulosa HHB12029]
MFARPLPSSMRELRRDRNPNYHVDPPRWDWVPFEAFFRSNGLTLWTFNGTGLVPPDARTRAPDGFSYRHPDAIEGPPQYFSHMYADLCPARTIDSRDVVIRIISIDDDGLQQKQALERLATGNVASVIGNHAIPVLQWLKFENITFAVFPFLSSQDPSSTWGWEDVSDLLDSIVQMVEAVAFCQFKFVVHRDLFRGNFLSNFVGGQAASLTYLWHMQLNERAKPLRSLFPFRIYLIDFELALCFDEESDLETRFVRGIPLDNPDITYVRPVAPEMRLDVPYDAFAANVWQIGKCILMLPVDLSKISTKLSSLFSQMTSTLPGDRPTASQALASLQEIRSGLSLEQLRDNPPYRPLEDDEW